MSFLKIENISKTYLHHQALDNISIDVKKGIVFGLLGPNGAGKTTLIRIINQIIAADQGEIFLEGKRLSADDVRNIGYLPEERGLYKKMKVGEQAIYLARLKGLSRKEAIEHLKYWFKKFEITAWWDKKVEELSKGMQQKIQFIVTILHEPKLLIFDEPFSGFDPINANLLKQEILKLKEKGATIIFSTHNMASVEEICDDIALINNAKKILDGSVKDVKASYKTNRYEIVFDGDINAMQLSLRHQYKVLKNETKEGLTNLILEVSDASISTNDLIASLLPLGKIRSFSDILPSIDDIFIKVVNENKQAV